MEKQDALFGSFDQFVKTFMPQFSPQQQIYFMENWEQFLKLLQAKPLDYGKVYTLINKLHNEEIPAVKQQIRSSQTNRGNIHVDLFNQFNFILLKTTEERQNSLSRPINKANLTAASSPRIISSVTKTQTSTQNQTQTNSVVSNQIIPKYSQMDSMQSPKITMSNLQSQQQLLHKNSLQTQLRSQNQIEEFNRHLLLSKTKELLFTLSVSSDKLNAMARLPMAQKENLNPKSPIKSNMIYNNKTRGSNHSAENYRAVV